VMGSRLVVPRPEQPDWLRRFSSGFEKGWKWTVYMENERFAIVRDPGGNFRNGQSTEYGGSSYFIVDKTLAYYRRLGQIEEVHAGRPKKADIEKMKALLQEKIKTLLQEKSGVS
jgi:hypothetical protein